MTVILAKLDLRGTVEVTCSHPPSEDELAATIAKEIPLAVGRIRISRPLKPN